MKYLPGLSGNINGRPINSKSKKTVINDAFRLLNSAMSDPSLSLEARIQAAGAVVASQVNTSRESKHEY